MSKSGLIRRVDQLQAERSKTVTSKVPDSLIRKMEEEQREGEVLAGVPEENDLITRRHLRSAARVKAAGDRLGATVDRLPIRKAGSHQKGARIPKGIQFEGSLQTLIEKYGVEEAFEHMSNGQLTKYDLRRIGNRLEVWNTRTGAKEWPGPSPLDPLRKAIRDLNVTEDFD